jgi:hypothetical protein
MGPLIYLQSFFVPSTGALYSLKLMVHIMNAHKQVRLLGTVTFDKFQMGNFSLCRYFMKTMFCCLKFGTDLHTDWAQNGTGQCNIQEPTELHLHKSYRQSPGVYSCYNISAVMFTFLLLGMGNKNQICD